MSDKLKIGNRFGRLVIIAEPVWVPAASGKYSQRKIECKCDCGGTVMVAESHLGYSTFSCGCLRKHNIASVGHALKGTGEVMTIEGAKLRMERCNSRAQFQRNYTDYYRWLVDTNNIALLDAKFPKLAPDEIINPNPPIPESEIIERAKLFQSREEWESADTGADRTGAKNYFIAAAKKGRAFMRQVCEHMPVVVRPPCYQYTEEEIVESVKAYQHKGEWKKGAKNFYQAARTRPEIFEKATAHMTPAANPYAGNYIVYGYEFETLKKAYVGLTFRPERRKEQHLYCGPVYSLKQQHPELTPVYKVLEEDIPDPASVQAREAHWMHHYEANGWIMLNSAKAGSLGSLDRPGTCQIRDNVIEDARHYATRKEWYLKSQSCYVAAKKYGWFEEAVAHMPRRVLGVGVGLTRTDEAKQKMREAKLGTVQSKASKAAKAATITAQWDARRKATQELLLADPTLSTASTDDLCRRHGISQPTLRKHLKELGIKHIAPLAPPIPAELKAPAPDPVKPVAPLIAPVQDPIPAPVELPAPAPSPIEASAILSFLTHETKVSLETEGVKQITSNKCHQRVIRDRTRDEDIAQLTPKLGDLSELKASQFDLACEPYAKCHRDFIKRYEWLGTPGISIKWCFTARYKGELGGVVLMSEPYYPSETDALICRGACAGWTPKNVASRMIMFACNWMVQNTPKRIFNAYIDQEAKEYGSIYSACNFKFLGWKEAEYGVDVDGNRKSFQTLKRTSRMVPWLAKQGITLPDNCFTAKKFLRWGQIPTDLKKAMREHIASERAKLSVVTLQRGRYVLLLGKNKTETKALLRNFTEKTYPYPKRAAVIPLESSVITSEQPSSLSFCCQVRQG